MGTPESIEGNASQAKIQPYLRAANQLYGDISEGKYVDVVPPLTALGKDYGVSYVTMQKAMKVLERRGIVEIRKGSRTHVKRDSEAATIERERVELERIAHRRGYQRDWQRRKYHANPEPQRERSRQTRKRKKEAAIASGQIVQQATEQSGNILPVHPIFDRLSHALATQQTTERQRRTRRREKPSV
jgi:DNA-binding transcriptional regulator YhcF (GntR family)